MSGCGRKKDSLHEEGTEAEAGRNQFFYGDTEGVYGAGESLSFWIPLRGAVSADDTLVGQSTCS